MPPWFSFLRIWFLLGLEELIRIHSKVRRTIGISAAMETVYLHAYIEMRSDPGIDMVVGSSLEF